MNLAAHAETVDVVSGSENGCLVPLERKRLSLHVGGNE